MITYRIGWQVEEVVSADLGKEKYRAFHVRVFGNVDRRKTSQLGIIFDDERRISSGRSCFLTGRPLELKLFFQSSASPACLERIRPFIDSAFCTVSAYTSGAIVSNTIFLVRGGATHSKRLCRCQSSPDIFCSNRKYSGILNSNLTNSHLDFYNLDWHTLK
jgi:hypothetical protein